MNVENLGNFNKKQLKRKIIRCAMPKYLKPLKQEAKQNKTKKMRLIEIAMFLHNVSTQFDIQRVHPASFQTSPQKVEIVQTKNLNNKKEWTFDSSKRHPANIAF
jgi:hypothetical protein